MVISNVAATAMPLSENDPYGVVELGFTYSGTTPQHGTTVYFGALLSDGTNSEDVLFPLAVTSGDDIPANADFSYTPAVTFSGTVSATEGKVYYTA